MRILIACEFSGRVRDAFRAKGHDAVSCDLRPTERAGPHIQDDVLKHLNDGWDAMIGFPDCTHLASSGARWFPEKIADGRQPKAKEFFMALVNAPIPKICIENPIGIMSTAYRKPDQIIHPWMFGNFGENESKSTCLWLKGFQKLQPVNPLPAPHGTLIHHMAPHPDRAKNRSRTFKGIAEAMANQWS